MKKYDINLRPVHYACVSGGKDSLYMLKLILENLDKYPLDCVVHFELEIDWNWVKGVISQMEKMCSKLSIPFYRIKPRDSWFDLVKKYDIPSRQYRWCNSMYKLDAERQFVSWIESQSCRPVAYIGFCADEDLRFKYSIGDWKFGRYCYPLAEEGITEDVVLLWARKNSIFQDWYKYFNRQGCKFCPLISRKELAYLCKYERSNFDFFMDLVDKFEKRFNSTNYFHRPALELKEDIICKWVPRLTFEESQYTLFDI